jgi:hypothetical protein
MAAVQTKLAQAERLDFDTGQNEIPQEWYRLRSEAWGPFHQLHILSRDGESGFTAFSCFCGLHS